MPRSQRALDRLDGSRKDVPEQEDEDPGRDGSEHRAEARRDVPQPRDRQADEDRAAGDRAEEKDFRSAHLVVRVTLHTAGT